MNFHRWLDIYTRELFLVKKRIYYLIENQSKYVQRPLTLRYILQSVNRSMQQIFLSYVTRSRAGFVELISMYLRFSDLITGLLKFCDPNTFSIEPNTFLNDPDDVPMGKPR